MGDWFDLNNDGKLDPFEESCKLSHINNCIRYLKQEEEKKAKVYQTLFNEYYNSIPDPFDDSMYSANNISTYTTNYSVNNSNIKPANNTNDTPIDLAAISNSWIFKEKEKPPTLLILILIIEVILIYVGLVIIFVLWK